MQNRLGMLTMVLVFALWVVASGSAQQGQNVQITNGPVVENVTGNSAEIAWSTNVNSGSVIRYGTDRNNLDQTAQVPWGGVTHRVNLQNLQPNTTYYYQVESPQAQGTGTGATSGISQFKTTSGQQGTGGQASAAPQPQMGAIALVAGPIPQQVADSSAKLWWRTNQPLTGSMVKYGSSPGTMNQQAQATESGDQMSHTAELTGLQPDTQYYVQIVRQDGSQSATGTFRTKPANYASSGQVHVTDGPVIEYLADNQAVISWSTSAPSSSVVRYGTDQKSMNQTAQGPWTSGTHRVRLTNLQPNTKYWFQIHSAQAKGTGTMAESGSYPFQTIAPGQAALKISK